MPKLQVSFGDGREETFDLEAEVITLGRLADNMIQIDDGSVSSHHAQMTRQEGGYALKDLNSTNGTRHNGEQLTEATLADGDSLRFGKVQAKFFSDTVSSAQPMPEQEGVAAEVAQSSSKPTDFSNASPFKAKAKSKKSTANAAIIGVAVLAILAFAYALVNVAMLSS